MVDACKSDCFSPTQGLIVGGRAAVAGTGAPEALAPPGLAVGLTR